MYKYNPNPDITRVVFNDIKIDRYVFSVDSTEETINLTAHRIIPHETGLDDPKADRYCYRAKIRWNPDRPWTTEDIEGEKGGGWSISGSGQLIEKCSHGKSGGTENNRPPIERLTAYLRSRGYRKIPNMIDGAYKPKLPEPL